MSLQKGFRDLSLEEGWKRLLQSKAPSQSAAYQDAVNKFIGGSDLAQKRVGDVLSYAQQSPDHTLDIANDLTGRTMTRYKPGDIRSVNRDTIHKGVMDEVAYKRFLSSMGIFDSEQYATNPLYNTLPQTGYLESLLPKYQQKVAAAETEDAEHQERNSYRVNTWQHWSDMQNRLGEMNENNAPYFWAYADYLLNGDVSKPFDMDSYNNAWDAMDDEQFFADQDAKRAQFDSLDWDKLTDKNASVKDQLYNSGTNSAKGDFSMIQNEVTRRQTIENLETLAKSNPEFASLSVYKDEYVAPERGLFSGNAFEPYVQGMDDLNRFLNADFGWQTKEIAAQHSIAVRKYLDNGYDFMSDDELAVYNTLYNTDQSKAAEYLEALRPDLLYRRSQVNQTVAEAYATNPVTGAPSFFGAVASSVLRPFQLPQQIYEAATGRDNPYSAAHDLANNAGYVYGAQDAALGEISMPDWMTVNGKNILQHLYGAATSGFENAARIIAAGGNPTVALIFAGLQSGSASLQESAGRDDMSGAAKIIKAIGTAAMEVGTEKIGLDALFDTGRKGALSYIKNVILSEMGEEALNYISEDVIESVVAFLFDHEADIKSGPEFWQGLTDIMIQTALSGDMMGTTGAVTQRIGTSSTGSALRSRGDIEGVLAIGDSMAAGTDPYTETQAVREKQKAGKKVSNYDLGRVVKAIAKDIGDENSAVVTKVYDEAIEDRLVELGDTVESAKKNAPVIRKMSMGQKLSAMERASVMWSDNATQVVKELTAEQKADTSVGNAAEAEGQRAGQKWRTEMGSAIREKTADLTGKQLRFTEALTRKTSTSAATSKAAEKAKKLHGKGTDLTAKNMSFGDTSGEFQKVTKKNGKFFVEVSDGKTTTEAALDDVTSFDGEGLGTVLEYTQEAAHEMTAAEVNTMANAYMETGGDAQSFIANYESAYLSGYSGLEMPSNDLSDGIRAMAYEHGKAEAAIEETNRVTRAAGRRAQKTATTSWLGKVSGDNAIRGTGSVEGLSEALEGMTESQRFVADFASEFGQQTGINIVLFEGVAGSDGKITTQNGSYDSATNTIYLDINSGANTSADLKSQRNSGTLGYALMRTLGHEVTHAIEATSTEFYAKYKQAVKDELKVKGLDWSVLVRQKIDAAVADGKKLTYAGAEAEVVADASEYMLQDSKFVKNLDNSIKGKIKTIIRDFMDKVNTVFRNLTGGHIESVALRESVDGVYHYTKNLQELWDAALDEMVVGEYQVQMPDGVVTAEAMELAETDVQHSLRTAPDPKKTQQVYKLMRLKDGKIYPLFIDSTEPLVVGEWYDADSPNLDFLRNMPSGIFLVDTENESYQSFEEYLSESGEKKSKYPSKNAIKRASAENKRWVWIEDTAGKQKRFAGETRKYWNLGINGSGTVSKFSMRPGYHAGSLPTMRQIGKGPNQDLRDDSFVWTVGQVPADIDYQPEADRNPDKDIPTHIPVDGYYMKATNANKAKSQADRVGWYVAGSYKIDRIISDSEARQVIDDWNAEHPDAIVEYDYERESGMDFDAETMRLVERTESSLPRSGLPEGSGEVTEGPDGVDEAHPMSRQFSTRQLAESLGYELKMLSGTDVPYAIVDSNGNEVTSFTADQIRNTPIGGLIEAAVAAGNIDPDIQRDQLKMIADLATLAAQYKDQAIVWEIAGSQLYSAIKNNSDKQYNKTVDFGTICSKTQAVVDVLSETMLRLDRGLTREEVITAYNKTAKNGLSVPCGPCYVFSRWMGVPGLLNSMANYQRRFGKMSAEEVTEYIDGVQERYASDGERFSKVIGKQKTKLENRLESIASRMQRAMATGADMTALFREADEVEREYADVEAYNWVTQVLCQNKRVKGAVEVLRDSNGIVKIDPAYKPVPHSILFDMRRTGEFAKYPKSWKYRSTRGAGMGKSILPYSGASLGDTVYGEQKRRATSQNAFLNPNMTKAQRVRAIKNATKRMKSQNLIGGHRFQSTSDYRPEWGLDYIMTFLEMQAVSAKGQLYTKVIEAVDMFASAGIEVNLSIMANGDGWHRDENGNPVLGVEDFSSVSGIDFTEALQKTRDYDNVQMILVGMNDTHIRLALADDRITFVIPWHSSGSSESILKQLFDAVGEELHTGSDYQEIQSDKPVPKPSEKQRQNAALRTKIITGKFAKNLPTEAEREAIEANEFLNDLYTRFYLDPSATDTYGVKLSSEQASQVFPYEYWDTSLTYKDADENGRRFVRYCEDIGLVPRFEKFKEDTGYWKLLIDRRMYNRDGTYHTPAIIDVTGVKIGDIASSVSQAKYGDPAKTGNAVMETIEELRTKAGTPAYPEPSIVETVDGYGDEVEIEARPIQKSTRDLSSEITVRDYLAQSDESAAATIEERNALTIYQKLLKGHADASEKVTAAEQALLTASEADKPEARKALAAVRIQQKDIYNRLLNVERTPHVQSVVKRTNQLMGDLSGKTQSDVERMIADRERTIANLKADITGLKGAVKAQREADIRENERQIQQLKSKAAQALLKNSEHYQRQIDEIRMRRDMNLEIGKKTRKIRRIVKALNDRITHEEDYKNVKEPLKPAVHKLVQTFIDGFGSLVFDQKQADHLKRIYDEISKEDAAPEFWSDDVSRWIGELADLAEQDNLRRIEGSTSVGALTEKLVVYSQVADIADSIYHMVTAADELFVDGKRMQFDAYTASVGNALLDHKDAKLHTGKARTAFRVWDDLIRTGNMTPQFFFESLKNDGVMSLFKGLLSGQTKYAQAIREGRDFVSEAKRRHNYYTWQNMKTPMAYRTKQGHDIALTVEQAMWVYATAKREASNTIADTHHLEIGGFEYDDKGMPKGIAGINRTHRLNAADVANISNMLTAEQRAYADEMVQYLSEDMAELGNEASMELFGIRKYNEKYYFPFKVSSGQRHQRSDAGSTSTTSDARVKHSSFTHALTRGANTTLVIGNFTDIIADHINQMATYSSFVVPIESMNRVLNRKINDEKDGSGSDVTIRSMIARKYGESAQKYISDLLKDLNGGPQVDNRGGLSALFRAFQRGAVLGSLSVAVQQPTAMIRAFAYINPKYFAHITGEGNKQTWERMMKYSGTTVIKDEGKFDVGTGKMANDWIANSDIGDYKIAQRARFLMDTKGWEAVKDNFLETLTALPGVMDRITWTHIWKAVEAEQADQNPGMDRNSDAFLTMVGQRFDDIINHTQVYDSILARSQNMRSKNPLAQMSTAFMSEPTLNMNLFYSAFTGEHSKAQRTGIVASVIGANILAAAFAAAVSAWNKDDDDRTAAEKYLESFVSRAVDNLNPLTMLPYVSDLWNILNGYDVERTDWSVVVDIVDAGGKFFDKVLNGETVTAKNVEDFFGSVANLTGVPLRNWFRDGRRLFNFIHTDKSLPDASAVKYTMYEAIAPFGLYQSSNSAYYDRYIAALMDGDKQESYDLREFLTVSKKIGEDKFLTGARDAYKKVYLKGGIKKEAAIKFLTDNKLADSQKSAFGYVDRWEEGSDGHSVYNTLEQAFETGSVSNIQTAWKELTSNGYTDKQVGEQTRTILKGLVQSGKITPSKATELLRKWYPYKKDSDNIDKPKEWLETK